MARSLKDLKSSHKKALIIAAHPDDESLFMGGTIAEFKKWHWTVLCVTDCDKRYDKRRRRELLRACRIYNGGGSDVTPFMLGITRQKGRFSKRRVAQKVRDFIDEFGPFDIFFTHDNKGDYGHKTHKLVHDTVKKLKLRNVYNFYIPAHSKKRMTPPGYMEVVKLSPGSRRVKMKAINVYLKGSQKTNLSRLKKVISPLLNTKAEHFHRVN